MVAGETVARLSNDGNVREEDFEPDAEYVRRAYDRAIDWYKVAENKAQLLLTVKGLLVTVFVGSLTGKTSGARPTGVETRIFIFASATAVVAAVSCAAAGLWSRHTINIKEAFAKLEVNPANPDSYKPEVLWYFGHLARLDHGAAASMVSSADRRFEVTALSYNLVDLSVVVLRKHRFVNLGWALTASAIVFVVIAGVDVYIRAQL
jgi:hypothetical protein